MILLVNSVNEYTVVDSTSRSHDDNGDLIDDGTFTYCYDALNRLVMVRSSGNTITKNLYDTKGRRVRHTVTNTSRFDQDCVYYYAGNKLIEEYDVNSSLARRNYVLGGMGERFKSRTWNGSSVDEAILLEKLDSSIGAHATRARERIACYDDRVQALVEAVDPGSDGDFSLCR